MGYMRHHAIVVSGWKAEHLESAHVEAKKLFPWVSDISPEAVNGYVSFFIPPDGSKEGWNHSDEGDTRRNEFIQFLRNSHPYLDWVEIMYGDDEGEAAILSHSRDKLSEDTP